MGDDDYLSDDFLVQASAQDEERKRNNHDKRNIAAIFTSSELNKQSKLELERAQLTQGLSKPIAKESKGYAMLAKMGYRQNEAKPVQAPILPPALQALTREVTAEQERKKLREQARDEEDEKDKQEFRRSQAQRFENRRAFGLLSKIRRVEENLGIEQDDEPSKQLEDEESVEESSVAELSNDESHLGQVLKEPDYQAMLALRVKKLRQTPYFFCFYCGCKYTDEKDLLENCPGTEEKDHD